MSKFIVINARRGPSRYPHVHSLIESAQAEADRIASQDPGAKVYVLQVVGYMQKRDVKWESNATPDLRDVNTSDCLRYSLDGAKAMMADDDQVPF